MRRKLFIPYRISLFGAYSDCFGGDILGKAIDAGIHFEWEPAACYHIKSFDFDHEVIFALNAKIIKRNDWADYFRGAIKYLSKKHKLNIGATIEVSGELPCGGLSSSAAFTIGCLSILCEANGIKLTENEFVSAVQEIENDFVWLKSGKMDPACIVMSKPDKLLLYDCANAAVKNYLSYPDNWEFIIFFSGTKRSLVKTGGFNSSISDAARATGLAKYCGDDQRLLKLSENDIMALPASMTEASESFISNTGIPNKQMQDLFSCIKSTDGVLGVRFAGAGIDGFCIAIVDKSKADYVQRQVYEKYITKYEIVRDYYFSKVVR